MKLQKDMGPDRQTWEKHHTKDYIVHEKKSFHSKTDNGEMESCKYI